MIWHIVIIIIIVVIMLIIIIIITVSPRKRRFASRPLFMGTPFWPVQARAMITEHSLQHNIIITPISVGVHQWFTTSNSGIKSSGFPGRGSLSSVCLHGAFRLIESHRASGNFTSQDFGNFLLCAAFCADSSPPQISAIHLGNFTLNWSSSQISAILRKTSTTIAQKNDKILAREIPYRASSSRTFEPSFRSEPPQLATHPTESYNIWRAPTTGGRDRMGWWTNEAIVYYIIILLHYR